MSSNTVPVQCLEMVPLVYHEATELCNPCRSSYRKVAALNDTVSIYLVTAFAPEIAHAKAPPEVFLFSEITL